jgi:TonB family protein
MRAQNFILLFSCCLLAAACTTPAAPYEVGGRSAATDKEAAALITQSANAGFTSHFSKADSPPKLIKVVVPSMSFSATNHGGVGYVLVEVFVAKDGRVSDVRILESPNQYASEDTYKAVMQWEFSPLIERGEPKAFTYRQSFRFRLRA